MKLIIQLINFFLIFNLFLFCFLPIEAYSSPITDPSVISLQDRISNNFTRKYCKAIDAGLSKNEAMRSAIIETENIVAFSFNPQKKWIGKEELAEQISIKVVNKCGWDFGLLGKEGINYFKNFFFNMRR